MGREHSSFPPPLPCERGKGGKASVDPGLAASHLAVMRPSGIGCLDHVQWETGEVRWRLEAILGIPPEAIWDGDVACPGQTRVGSASVQANQVSTAGTRLTGTGLIEARAIERRILGSAINRLLLADELAISRIAGSQRGSLPIRVRVRHCKPSAGAPSGQVAAGDFGVRR